MNAELSELARARAAHPQRSIPFYDRWVRGVSNRYIWKCESEKILSLYREKISSNHLEVGVGTGYFLEQSLSGFPRLALLDIHRDFLDRTARRLQAYQPEVFQGNILEPLSLTGKRFDSIAIHHLLHCLPGGLEVKAGKVFAHLLPFLENDGIIFGSTILGRDLQRPFLAKVMMDIYNAKGIFCNTQDSLGGIMEPLSKRFKVFNVEVSGCVVLFWGKGLRDGYRHGEKSDG